MLVREILAIKGVVLYTIGPNHSLQDGIDIMVEHDIGSLVVFESGKLVGLLTFREMLSAVSRAGRGWREALVRDAMIADPMVATSTTGVDELRAMMVEQHQRYLPVVDDGTLMGVVSFHDVAKAVLEEQGFENKMLKNYIKNWPTDGEGEGDETA